MLLLGKSSWRKMIVSCLAKGERRRPKRRPSGLGGSKLFSAAVGEALESRVMLAAPVGVEHQVNTHTEGDQQTQEAPRQSVANDAEGNYVVTWSSFDQDGNFWGVYARQFDVNGNPLGGEFQVNQNTPDSQRYSSVAMNASGQFVIAWTTDVQDGDGFGIYARRFAADGTPLGDEFPVNSGTTNDQSYPSVALNDSGHFVIAWTSDFQDGSGAGIYAQRFDENGDAAGSEFLVNTTTDLDQRSPSVSMNNSGQFVIAWESLVGGFDGGFNIHAQRYDADGSPVGTETLVNTTTDLGQQYASVSLNESGEFIVSWSSNAQDGSGYGVYLQRFDNSGAPVGSETLVNTTTDDAQLWSSVSLNDLGQSVITWTSFGQDGANAYGVYAREFDANGNALANEFLVNTTTNLDQWLSSAALNEFGHYVVVWTSFNQDGDGQGVFAQRYLFPNTPPTAHAGGPYTGDEGASIVLDASASTDPEEATAVLTFEWDLDYDGVTFNADATGIAPTVSFPDNFAARNIAVRVTDARGESDIATTMLTVGNVAPVANAGNDRTVNEGDTVQLNGSFTDPGTDDTHTFLWEVSADNGQTIADGTSEDFSFVPSDNGTYTVSLTVTDDDGGMTSDETVITVENANPAVTITGAPANSPEGTEITLGTSVTDPGSADTHSFAWEVTKDGNPFDSGAGDTFAFTPDDNGTYVVTVTATDDDGGTGMGSTTITVDNAAPTVDLTGAPANSPEGTEITLGTTVTDAGSADTHTLAWNVTKNGASFTTGTGVTFAFTPDDDGTYIVTVTATDNDGDTGEDSVSISVDNADPAVEITGAPANSPEGTEITLETSVTDAGSVDTHTFAWEVTKDGSPFDSGAGETFAFTPDDNGSYVVTVTATDDDGGDGNDSVTITVDNVEPAVEITGAPANSPEGTEITLGTSVTDAGSADTHTFAWEVTKDGNPFDSGAGQNFAFTPDDNGSYVVTVTATDDEGGDNSDSATITVDNAAPVVTITGAPANSPEGTEIVLGSTVTDAGQNDTHTLAWTVTKDGNPYETGTGASFAFTPDDGATYVVTLVVTDNDGGTGTDSVTILVENLPGPSLVAPIGSADALQPEFSWAPIAGVDHYDIWVNVAGSNQLVFRNQNVVGTSVVAPADLELEETYIWTVRGVTASGASGDWATAATFTVEVDAGLEAPEDLFPTGTSGLLSTFTWSPVDGADHYDLWVNVRGTGEVFLRDDAAANFYLGIEEFEVEQEYIWTVRAVNASGVPGPWATHVTFIALPSGAPPAGAPTLIGPTGTTTDTTPTLEWTSVADADHYDVWLNVQGTNELVVRDKNVSGTTFTPSTPLDPNQQYVWTVRAVSANDALGEWAAAASFDVAFPQAPPGSVPTLVGPSGTAASATPTFEWTAIAGATRYDLWVNVAGSNELVFRNQNVVTTQFESPVELLDGQTYIWTVRAFVGTAASEWADHATFDVDLITASEPALTPPEHIDEALTDWNNTEWWAEDALTV